jgi:hypothetical protein
LAAEAIAAVRSDRACVMVNRNKGSGTRVLIDPLLDGARPRGYAVQPRNHPVVAMVQARADWGDARDDCQPRRPRLPARAGGALRLRRPTIAHDSSGRDRLHHTPRATLDARCLALPRDEDLAIVALACAYARAYKYK